MHLYIGYKRYSSWSLRPWLAMQATGIEFTETVLPFDHDNSLIQLAAEHGIPAKVPMLKHEGKMIWDSLAVLEFLADTYPEKNLWPCDPALRALARSACAEMHSGFIALRSEHPMNCHRVFPMKPSSAVQTDLDRLATLWQHFEKVSNPKGEFLFGEFGIVDAMFAPVAWRCIGYDLNISPAFEHWSKSLMALPAMQKWIGEGARESWRVEASEQVGLV